MTSVARMIPFGHCLRICWHCRYATANGPHRFVCNDDIEGVRKLQIGVSCTCVSANTASNPFHGSRIARQCNRHIFFFKPTCVNLYHGVDCPSNPVGNLIQTAAVAAAADAGLSFLSERFSHASAHAFRIPGQMINKYAKGFYHLHVKAPEKSVWFDIDGHL